MADAAQPPRIDMSLVPYNREGQDIVLRHGSAVVLYDSRTRQISLGRDSSHAAAAPSTPHIGSLSRPDECPTCHRPLHGEFDGDLDPSTGDPHEATFTDPGYFRLLHRSHPHSNASTQPSTRQHSPRRRLPPVSQSGQRIAAGGAGEGQGDSDLGTPGDAVFIGSAPAPTETAGGISAQAFSPKYFERFFIVEKELGKGGKGVVYLVSHVLDDVYLGKFAVKRVPVGNDHDWLKKVLVEVQLLTSLTHPNLVQYKHVWLEDYQISTFGPSVPCAFILQQFCNGGDLHNYMLDPARLRVTPQQMKERLRRRSKGQLDALEDAARPRRMNFEEIFSFFKDITAGLHHLHANSYIHRDLKPSNCLLHRDAAGQLRVLVSDFGEVQVVSAERRSTGSTGTISYCAPEVLQRDAATGNLGNFSTKSDIFSLGMIVYFMCFGRLPYKSANQLEEEHEDVDQLRDEIATWAGFDEREKQRSDLPDRLYKFLKRLLSIEPNERPSTDDILHNIGAGGDPDELGSGAPPRPHVFDDIRSRVQNIDSPSPTPKRMPSERRGTGSSGRNIGASNGRPTLMNHHSHSARRGSSLLRPVSPPKPVLHQDSNRTAFVEAGGEEDDNYDDHNATESDESANAQSLESSLTLRPRAVGSRGPSSPSSPIRTQSFAHATGRRMRQTLLLPPPPPTLRSHFAAATTTLLAPSSGSAYSSSAAERAAAAATTLRLVLFLVKVVTLLRPCAPYAPRAAIAYPLLALAALDFVWVRPGVQSPGGHRRRRVHSHGAQQDRKAQGDESHEYDEDGYGTTSSYEGDGASAPESDGKDANGGTTLHAVARHQAHHGGGIAVSALLLAVHVAAVVSMGWWNGLCGRAASPVWE